MARPASVGPGRRLAAMTLPSTRPRPWSDAARFVCIFRPGTSTEEVADDLRGQIARAIGVKQASLVKDHAPDNFNKEIRPALERAGVSFLRTHLSHDEIPKFFIPALLKSAANSR